MNLWIEIQRYLIDFTLGSLARRKWRNLSLLLVDALLVFMLVSVTDFYNLQKIAARRAW